MTLPRDERRMPVFALVQRGSAHAAHPDHRGTVPDPVYKEELVQVGSARPDDIGRYLITLHAMPLDGQLILIPDTTPAEGIEAEEPG